MIMNGHLLRSFSALVLLSSAGCVHPGATLIPLTDAGPRLSLTIRGRRLLVL